ncbi:MAG TPA: tetratricopeptide repeat protein, partial [Candidatus Kapabacteria bacterium]|nr:tetratricopeptide repeat protein [Candidatus Kapabacteria bacterium]
YITDAEFEQWLAKISDGNSLFITQFLKTLREDEYITGTGKFIGNYGAIQTPPSVLAVVEERTRRLDQDVRNLLSYATAEGEEFTTYVLSKLGNREPLKLLHDLRDATQKHIIVERGRSRSFANQTTTVFGFSHALFHKVLYEQLMEEEKAILHRQCYEILRAEWQHAEEKGEHPASLASKLLIHAEKCEEWETACNIALKAAKDAWRSYAHEETNDMIEKCLADAAHLSRNAALLKIKSLILRSEMNMHHAQFEDALTVIKEVHALCAEIHEEEYDDDASIEEALALNHLGKYNESLQVLDGVLQRARAREATNSIARALRFTGTNYYRLGEYRRALEYYQEALSITTKNKSLEESADLGYIGETYRLLGEYDRALEYTTKALDIARKGGNKVGMCYQLGNVALAYYALGKYPKMLEYLNEGIAIAEAIGNRSEQTAMLARIGLAYHGMGDITAALKYFQQSLTLAEATADKLREAEQTNNIGAIYSELGDRTRALEYLKRSLALKEELGSRAGQASTLINIGDNFTLAGDYEHALEYYNRSLEIANATGIHNFRIIGYTNGACAYRLSGKLDLAREWLEKGKSILQENDDPSTKAEFLRESGMLEEAEAIAMGNGECGKHILLARDYLQQAERIFREINHQPKAEKCAKELARINNTYKV